MPNGCLWRHVSQALAILFFFGYAAPATAGFSERCSEHIKIFNLSDFGPWKHSLYVQNNIIERVAADVDEFTLG